MRLDVWIEAVEAPVGTLDRRADKSLEFAYADAVPKAGRLSAAMPIRDTAFGDAACTAFFGNLLFEGRELDRVMAAHQIDRDDIGGLLFHLGADCPGAVSITPAGSGPGKRPGVFPDDYEEIPPARLAEIVRSLHFGGRLPEGARDPSPVAGVQPKIAVLHHEMTPPTYSSARAPRTEARTASHISTLDCSTAAPSRWTVIGWRALPRRAPPEPVGPRTTRRSGQPPTTSPELPRRPRAR